MSEERLGTTLLQVKPGAYHTWIPLLLGPLLLFAGTLVAAGGPKSRGSGILAIVCGLVLVAIAVRGFKRDTVLIEVTDRGIMFHANADGICVSFSLLRDLFIPWERLETMRFLTSRQLRQERLYLAVGRGPWAPGCIGLKLRMNNDWPEAGTLREGAIMRRAKPGEIYFQTAVCSPGGRQLWNQMAAIVGKYGGRDLVVEPESGGARK